MKDLTLVVMAAGMGSRFGGLKQITPVDADGNFIIDYSVYDAIKAGFTKVVFVIKEEIYEEFKETIGKRLEGILPVYYAFQRITDVPIQASFLEQRVKPWGTVQAILAAKPYVTGDFAVINADDFYGQDSYQQIASFFQEEHQEHEYVSVPFPFCETSSLEGAVKRGVCKFQGDTITKIVECSVEEVNGEVLAQPLDGKESFSIAPDALVSMNIFGFKFSFFELLEEYFREFFQQSEEDILKKECLLPMCLEQNLAKKNIVLYSRPSKSKWLGMTYKEDLDFVKKQLEQFVLEGIYPRHLWKY